MLMGYSSAVDIYISRDLIVHDLNGKSLDGCQALAIRSCAIYITIV